MPALLRRGLETLIRPYPALEVTSIGPEVDPAAAAIGKADVDAIWGAAVAAYGISARLEFLMIPLAFGVGSALTALVGRASGAGDWHTARRTAWTGGIAAFVFTGAIGAAG